MKYIAIVTATFDVEAENIVEARRAVSRLKTIGGAEIGFRRVGKSRDPIRYHVRRQSQSVTVERAKEGTEP